MYANTFFQTMDFDAVTVAPYMGHDSIQPFLDYPGKWVVLLALTSNKGADDFQFIEEKASGKRLFEIILEKSGAWASVDQMMYVAGATRAEMLADIRRYIPDHFLLVPGIGAQGGSLEEVCRFGMNRHCGLLVNSSRGIIYADPGLQFAMRAAEKARELQEQMETILEQRGLL
jgi:orotidine-5'-phosphate decarboxylase